jgi:hypothetical protein
MTAPTPMFFCMCGRQKTYKQAFLYVWQRKELQTHFSYVWQAKELGLSEGLEASCPGRRCEYRASEGEKLRACRG